MFFVALEVLLFQLSIGQLFAFFYRSYRHIVLTVEFVLELRLLFETGLLT